MDWLCSWPAFAIGVGLYLIVLIFKLVRDPDNAYVTHFIAIPFAIGALGVKFFDGFMADFLMFILLYLAGALGVFLLYLLIGRIIQKELVQNIVLAVISVAVCAVVVIAEVEIDWGNHDNAYYRPPTQSNSGTDWDDYDYNSDGNISQNEWEDALGDAMDQYEPYLP